ncbi:hypothetical protein HDU93_007414 [Gonapodya sp. JEL0774]|nr:hypothetical protein HDU93_007414 [Gonapodya sp. JEL0774]
MRKGPGSGLKVEVGKLYIPLDVTELGAFQQTVHCVDMSQPPLSLVLRNLVPEPASWGITVRGNVDTNPAAQTVAIGMEQVRVDGQDHAQGNGMDCACIDPWLLDVSPLCPLCKRDVRPEEEIAAAAAAAEGGESPGRGTATTEAADDGGERRRRRMIMGFGVHGGGPVM